MAEPTVHPAVEAVSRVMDQYDEQCANEPEWVAEAAEEVTAVRNAIDRCRGAVARAVRSQPTPNAEPPSIEDMAPATRLAYIIPVIEEWAGRVISDRMEPPLREGVKTWPAMKAQGYSSAIDEVIELVQHVIDGSYDLSRIDPSTIRDVTPPSTESIK